MYCRYCGKTIPDDALICCYCGKDQYAAPPAAVQKESSADPAQPVPPAEPEATPQPLPQSQPAYHADSAILLRSAPVLKQYRYNTSAKGRLVFGIVLFGIIGAISIIAMFVCLSLKQYILIPLWAILVFFSGATVISNPKAIRIINRTELNITAIGVFGCGADQKYRIVKEFELPYSRIVKVSSLPKHLVIQTQEDKYYLLIPNPISAEILIDEAMRQYQNQ